MATQMKKKNDTIFEDKKMDIKLELKSRIMESQVFLVSAIGDSYSFHTRQAQALCDDIENYKRILAALEDVKL